ncbi:Helicase associated domain protein [Streptomyces sp. NPDC029704]|uniref:DEAD/DEAH box helicase n=1 Tax=Streptomyces sp. NPDC029704 TaxID=3156920 RepID=UPI0033C74029
MNGNIVLRPYQEEAVTAIAQGLRAGGMGQLHAACGSGKTLMSVMAATRLVPGDGLLVVFAPSLALIAQSIRQWRALSRVDAVLAVCSDDTVADAPAHLGDIPAQVSTDPGEIAAWLRTARGRRLVVATYRSAPRLAEALRETDITVDLAVYDEAHHLSGRIDQPGRRMPETAFLPAVRRQYMTATPRIEHGVARSGTWLSMDDTSVFGPVLYSYPFSRGIAEGYLEDYRVFIVGIRASEARALLDDPDHEYVEGPGAPSLQTLVAQAALVRAAEKYGTRRALTFHYRIEHAQEFARTLPRLSRRLAPDLPVPRAAHVHGDMDHAVRDQILDALRHPPAGGWSVVANSRCLGEGVDIPAIDAILFAHPKNSAVDIVQAVGRALRPHPDTPGPSTIIIPLVVPEEDGELGDLEPRDYATLWHVIRALRAHDEPLGVSLDTARTALNEGHPRLPAKITVELPPGTAQDILNQVTLMAVRQTTSPWWEGYAAALKYRAEHGHLNVPLRHRTAEGFHLGQWLVKQRQFHRKGWLADDRITALEKASIVWDPSEARWTAAYESAARWHAEHGHLDIPQSEAGDGNDMLGQWIVRQRQHRRAGRLSEERIRRLDDLGMIWEHRDQAWQKNLDTLAAYRKEFGDTLVPQRYEYNGIRLGAFVSQMRAKYTAGKLSAQRISDLERVGMAWSDEHGLRKRALAAAVSWHRLHGSLSMPYDTRHDGVHLGAWLARQRAAHADGKLPSHLIDALNKLGMNWEPRPRKAPNAAAGGRKRAEQSWERGYSAAQKYARQHGHLRVPSGQVVDGLRLDAWLVRQRAARRAGRLTTEQINALTKLGIQWGRDSDTAP